MGESAVQPWQVVVVGRWNRSILTPIEISRRLLRIPENTKLKVEIPLNVVGPPRVWGDGIAIVVDDDRLVVQIERGDYPALGRGMEAAATAITFLERTPYTAVGLTLYFDLAALGSPTATNHRWDELLANGGYEITGHLSGRTLKWREGQILIQTHRKEGTDGNAMVNFERRSELHTDLVEWLKIPVDEIRQECDRMLEFVREGGVS
ncbi:MAG TPA: hypothetical protein VH475_14680 [Tepidisphaeraceae bacterium]|jgi:hypothetical protein